MNLSLDNLNKSRPQLTTETILSMVSEQDIYSKYIPKFETDINIKSPLRQERNPSFYVSRRDGKLLWVDWGTREGGDVFRFVEKYYNCNFNEALEHIDHDMHLGIKNGHITLAERRLLAGITNTSDERPKKVLDIVSQAFTRGDFVYWKSYGVNISTLEFYNVCSVKHLYLNKKHMASYSNSRPIFAYYYNNERTGYKKIYMPYSEPRFLFDGNDMCIDGLLQINGVVDRLVLTKSRKDVMLLYELGYPAVTLQSESVYKNEEVFRIIMSRAKEDVIILYDDDEAGRAGAMRVAQQYGFKISFIRGAKDVSDYYKAFGRIQTISMLKQLL